MAQVLALAVAAILLLPQLAGAAATRPAVAATSANPPAFVPNWDGHTDTTVVEYRLTERSSVLVRIIDARGRVVATIAAGRRAPGTHMVSWDGRGTGGRLLPPGTYRVRVDARPVPAAAAASGQPGAASMGSAVTVAGARAATIELQAPPVAVRGVRLGRAALGRSAKSSTTTVRFDLSTEASISAAIVDAQGRAVRTLAARSMPAGANTLAWNGRSSGGQALEDGEYALVVAASGGGRPTATTRLPVRIDRTMPGLRMPRRLRAAATAKGIMVPVGVTVDEATTVAVRVGRRTVRRVLEPGTHRLLLPGSSLGIVGSRRARTVQLHLVATDAAGNAVARTSLVVVPPVTRIVPRPTLQPPTKVTPGAFAWPIGGVVTSEFGMRNGRPHTGIDIAAPTGTPIHPIAPGTVSYVGVLGGYGNLVIVEHADGLRTWYAHMSSFGSFGVGDPVQPLDTIGLVGCTGSCTGPHVHFETRVNDVPRDPRSFLAPR